MQEPSIFMKIINGEIPSHKVYEDDMTYAILDIHPLNPGHVLVIPKRQTPFIWDLPTEDYQALMATVQKIGFQLKKKLASPYVGLQVVGVDVPHAHVHVIPFAEAHELRKEPSTQDPNHEQLAAMAEKIRF
jgi:histidine triad (HIT) family protein